jgi:hypothetical protein
MVRLIRPTLRDVTLRTLGDELGGQLLERGAVHPIYGQDRKNPGFPRHNEPWFKHDITDFLALGLNAGTQSGLTVWDIDSHDLAPPTNPNVLTRRGCHIWTPYRAERHQQAGVPHLDVRSNGNVVFWADNGEKTVVSTTLADPEVVHAYWEQQSGQPIRLEDIERIGTRTTNTYGVGEGTSTYAFEGLLLPDAPYVDQVLARGWTLDQGLIAQGAIRRVQKARAGRRNDILYQQSLHLIQCGIDPVCLLSAAVEGGLPVAEVELVLGKAAANYLPTRLPTVLDRVDSWVEAVTPVVDPRLYPVIGEIARRAVHQNTIAPMIVQEGFPGSAVQSTVSRQLAKLDQQGVIHRKSMGWRSDGRRRSNCYQLCVRRTVRFRDEPCACLYLSERDPYPWELGATWPAIEGDIPKM